MLGTVRQWIEGCWGWISARIQNNELWMAVLIFSFIILGFIWTLVWLLETLVMAPARWILGKEKLVKALVLALLFVPPLLFYIGWYFIENETIQNSFAPYEMPAQRFENEAQFKQYVESLNAIYDKSKNSYVTLTSPQKNSDFETFKSAVSTKASETLGILASLPTHRVCLENNNKFSYDEIVLPADLSDQAGAIGVDQTNGHRFYAKIGQSDCQLISRSRFLNSAFQLPSYGYEGRKTVYSDGHVEVAGFAIDPSKSIWRIQLALWTIWPFYLLVLPAWSLLFFQYRKIYRYISSGKIARDEV